MTSTVQVDGNEDVNEFLQRIRELGEKHDNKDDERTKKLEEEILQGRKERQARRAERARSISPTKDSSPLLDPARLSISSLSHRALDPPEQLAPSPQTPIHHDIHNKQILARDEAHASAEGSPAGSRLDGPEPEMFPKVPSPLLRSRAGTLSWQQRPSSRDRTANRPFLPGSPSRDGRFRAMSAASNDEHAVMRSPLASLPPSREPSFLGETEGDASRLQKTSVEEDSKHVPTNNVPLIGTGNEVGPSAELENENEHQDATEEQSRSPSRASSTCADGSLGNRYSSISSVSTPTGLGSPIPLSNTQKFEPPKLDDGSDGQVSLPPSPRRLSPERSTSPTKGLGGFVQSAMMKRSDSISKRWSAQLPSGLSRGSPFASNRNSFAAPSHSEIPSMSSISRLSREGSALSLHRPNSSHSEATIVHPAKDEDRPATPTGQGSSENTGRPSLNLHERSASTASVDQPKDSTSVPSTPPVSRTMDPRRWSPTKSTWLESALNRPESPRHKRNPSQQTSWAKDRQSRGSVDLGRRSSFKEVTPVGLLRTALPGSHGSKSSISGIPDVFSPQDAEQPQEDSPTEPKTAPKKIDPPLEDVIPEIPPPTAETTVELVEDDTAREDPPTSSSPATKLTPIDVPLASSREPIRDPLLDRPKPQSPVIDFRSNLRKREIVKDQSTKEEPEFKNVFGKLKKTETATYVAPDALKENILRGKASLNATGGPKRSQRTDELKESILKQRESMKTGGASPRRNTAGESDAPPQIVPEAIAKRNNLTKSSSVKTNSSPDVTQLPSPGEISTPDSPHSSLISSFDDEHTEASPPTQNHPEMQTFNTDDDQGKDFDFELPSDGANKNELDPMSMEDQSRELELNKMEDESTQKAIEPVRVLLSGDVAQAATMPALKQGHVTKRSLAGRINPALANIISRGPPAPVNGPKTQVPEVSSGGDTLTSQSSPSTPALSHMTKARARGPKRRPPKVATSIVEKPSSKNETIPLKTPPYSLEADTSVTSFSPIDPPKTSGAWPLPDTYIDSQATSEPAPPASRKPTEFNKSLPQLPREVPSPGSVPSTPLDNPAQTLRKKTYEDENRWEPPAKLAFTPSRSTTSPSSPLGGQPLSPIVHYSSPSPSPLRTNLKENQTRLSPKVTGVSSLLTRSRESSPFRKSLPLPPVPPKGPSSSADQLSSPRSSASLVPQADESLEAISRFFTTFPSSSDRVNIDPQLMLTEKRDHSKIRTLKKQIWEITGDGKRQDLPVNQEYILYEGAMYLCVHSFEAGGSVRSAVHLWCGDDVWDGAVEDALSFSRRVARDNGCKLEVIKQGKEPAGFIQALGGILITRRGSSSRSSSSAIFMLCGRKHLGQMVFDEVDYSPRNLCTGYPFVISAMFGTVYLWKGKGSSAEEIGAARLIGMDLGLTGEFEEVAEGDEPESFFEVFPQHTETGDYMCSGHWLSKPTHEHFRLRLLRVDHELGQRTVFWMRRPGSSSPVIRPNDTVQEVEPFCQKDLSAKGIYILDTFFEIYVIVGEQASNRPAEFASAVVFAHEYGILAASLQDRPFIPKSFVSLGGPPESCRGAFRKWKQRPLQKPPQVFPLNAAIDAIRS
ncbi:hypothetical protein ARAM_003742 [Aspergillus rambellii]|uniref:DUF4045 domain-containing protein n=1 Tax=Aspergillus rambellii TaxID=308745 RepID=A0A0F8XBJ7_9EURO|nr:hypothetical protein ARAM_003742 [Aspergillus rambellii]